MSSSSHWICSLQLPSLLLNLSKPQEKFNWYQRKFHFCSLCVCVCVCVCVYFVTCCCFLRNLLSLNNQLTNSMEQIPSRKANTFPAGQEISRIILHPIIHQNILNRPPPVPVRNKIGASSSYFLKIHFNIIYGPDSSLLCTFHLQNPISNSQSLHVSKNKFRSEAL
jgi:hypothetical protein